MNKLLFISLMLIVLLLSGCENEQYQLIVSPGQVQMTDNDSVFLLHLAANPGSCNCWNFQRLGFTNHLHEQVININIRLEYSTRIAQNHSKNSKTASSIINHQSLFIY